MTINRRTFVGAGLGLLANHVWAPRLRAATTAPHVLLVYASGGWDPTMVFDDKRSSTFVTAETGVRQGVGAGNLPYIDHASRPAVKAFFTAYGDQAAIVNGINAGAMDRLSALRTMWGVTPPKGFRPVDWLSYYTASLNPVLDIPHAVISAPYMPGDYASLAIPLNARTIAERLATIPHTDTLGDAGETALKAFRAAAYNDAHKAVNADSLDGDKLRTLYFNVARSALVKKRLAAVDLALGAQGSDSDFVHHGKLAIELFAQGASLCATVQAGATDLWDTRRQHFARQTANYEELFQGLNAILSYAATRNVADNLVVVVVSERGRAPRLDANGGKGPWPVTSALLWGAGIRGGTVVNASDAAMRAAPVSPLFGQPADNGVALTLNHVFAALYLRFSVPYKLLMPDIQPLSPILAGV